MLDQLIKQEESLQMSAQDAADMHGDDDKHLDPYLASEDVPADSSGRLPSDRRNSKPGGNLAANEIGEAENSLAPQTKRSMIQAHETLMIGKFQIIRHHFWLITAHNGSN